MAKESKTTIVTPDYVQDVPDRKDAKSHPGLVLCRKCSKPGHQVFHNKAGARRHLDEVK